MKLCKTCGCEAFKWRTKCLKCINNETIEKAKKKKQEEKIKVRKEKAKVKKQNSISYLTKKADNLWSECVKINYNYSCQYCWKKDWLNSHHLFTRARKSTRWNIDNWIVLCQSHHTLSSEFSAHQTWNEFFIWLESIKWREWIDELNEKSHKIIKVTPEHILACIKELEDFKNKNI